MWSGVCAKEIFLNSFEFVTAQACQFFPLSRSTVFYSVSDAHLASCAMTTSLTESVFTWL